MDWFIDLFTQDSVAHTVLLLGIVAAIGLAIGSIRVKGIGLGIAGVLFSGLIVGHFYGASFWTPPTDGHYSGGLNDHVLHFAQEFGLILFVYTIGVQVGPGFFASLRRQGLPLNIMAASIVLLGVVVTVGIRYIAKVETPAAVGLFSGASTNTPSLAAAQAALKDQSTSKINPATGQVYSEEETRLLVNKPVLGYAVAYPFGVIGIILSMLLIRFIGKVDPHKEAQALASLNGPKESLLDTMNIEVQNPNMNGKRIVEIPALPELGVVISRVLRGEQATIARRDTVLQIGDVLLAVGQSHRLEQLRDVLGSKSQVDVKKFPSQIVTRRVVVTQSPVLGKTVAELDLARRFGVMVTRLARAEVEIPPSRTRLQFGDTCLLVGDEPSIKEAALVLGDQVKKLSHPQVIPIFVGIVLGVIVGSWPMTLPGMPAPIKLGLAGGPLIVAIILSRLGHIGPLVWHLPASANLAIREIGIILFLACVGLRSGDQLLDTLMRGDGLMWMGMGALITIIPLMSVGLIGRFIYKVNFLTLCGVLAGSMTDPPALAFANTISQSDAPGVSYSTVYPLTMLLRVLCAQAMVLMMT
ncbi:MAG: putative transporter [Phycisphaerales bacterium]|nr:putative transporter [Phycisphaerales bacterium]